MKNFLTNFTGVLLGILIYSGLVQYTDTETIDVASLLFDFKPWIIAFLIALGLSAFTSSKTEK